MGCSACELGVRRKAIGGQFVFGEGMKNGIMFVGEGPGSTEEEMGRPFIGPSGKLLRDVLTRIGLTQFYITNLVSCRSCAPVLDDLGQPRFRHRRGSPPIPMFKDEPPLPAYVEACRARLYEEIYIVDPVVIVTLGGGAAEALLRRKVTITSERGQVTSMTMPGSTFRPVLTEKKKVWPRVKGTEITLPVEPTEVEYLVIPTLHPAYVLRKIVDRSTTSPFTQFVSDIVKGVATYERFMHEVYGVVPSLVTEAGKRFDDIAMDPNAED